jgi:hypothetical protein
VPVRFLATVTILCCLPAPLPALTEGDLSGRVVLDGLVTEYEVDEALLGTAAAFPESDADSPWPPPPAEILSLHGTWDETFLYLAVRAELRRRLLVILIDDGSAGLTGLGDAPPLSRALHFRNFRPRHLWVLDPDRGGWRAYRAVDGTFLEETENFEGAARFPAGGGRGGGEIRIPFTTFSPSGGGTLRLLAAVTGGPGTGAGDLAPDSFLPLAADSHAVAVADRFLEIVTDVDRDGLGDAGVSPASRSDLSPAGSNRSRPRIEGVVLERGAFSPDLGEILRFRPTFAGGPPAEPVSLSARVYAQDGELVRRLFEERDTVPPVSGFRDEDSWDGRAEDGERAPGGVYVLVVEVAAAGERSAGRARRAFAVVR